MTPNRRSIVRDPDEPAWAADVRELTIAVNRATQIKALIVERDTLRTRCENLSRQWDTLHADNIRLREAVRVAARVVTDHHEPDAAGGCR
jgi:hypothetical protein